MAPENGKAALARKTSFKVASGDPAPQTPTPKVSSHKVVVPTATPSQLIAQTATNNNTGEDAAAQIEQAPDAEVQNSSEPAVDKEGQEVQNNASNETAKKELMQKVQSGIAKAITVAAPKSMIKDMQPAGPTKIAYTFNRAPIESEESESEVESESKKTSTIASVKEESQ